MLELKTEMSEETENRNESKPRETEAFSPIPETDARCFIHPDKKAFRVCKSCGRSFCAKCLVHYYGIYYCEECGAKHPDYPPQAAANPAAHIPGKIPEPRGAESPEAARAFRLSLIGLIPLVGLVLEIIVLFTGFSAMSHSSIRPGNRTSRKALYAVLIAACSFILQVIAVLIVLVNLAT